MKIYTKKGDTGETGLYGGSRVPKDDLRISAYGTLDELNSVLGVVLAHGATLATRNVRICWYLSLPTICGLFDEPVPI